MDWVALSNTSVQFSVAALSRLSRASIDAFTLQVGWAICYNFSLEPNAQERISDAILRLKRYGSWRPDLVRLWNQGSRNRSGRHRRRIDASRTVCCIVSHLRRFIFSQSFAGALRALQGTPVLHTCIEAMESAGRAMCWHIDIRSSCPYRQRLPPKNIRLLTSYNLQSFAPTSHSALAESVLTLARISKQALVSTAFSGGLDCAWLAAFAGWVLSLEVWNVEFSWLIALLFAA